MTGARVYAEPSLPGMPGMPATGVCPGSLVYLGPGYMPRTPAVPATHEPKNPSPRSLAKVGAFEEGGFLGLATYMPTLRLQ